VNQFHFTHFNLHDDGSVFLQIVGSPIQETTHRYALKIRISTITAMKIPELIAEKQTVTCCKNSKTKYLGLFVAFTRLFILFPSLAGIIQLTVAHIISSTPPRTYHPQQRTLDANMLTSSLAITDWAL
jgi:hypothetical protein